MIKPNNNVKIDGYIKSIILTHVWLSFLELN